MKINTVFLIIVFATSLLLGFFIYNISKCPTNALALGIGSAICFFLTLIPAAAISVEDSRIQANLKVLSWIGVIILLIINLIFALTNSNITYYIITNGLLLLGFIAVAYSLTKAEQD